MKIRLTNLGQIENAIIEDEKLLIIVGDNGSGKTLLLESIALIRNNFSSSMVDIYRDVTKHCKEDIQIISNWKELHEQIETLIVKNSEVKFFEVFTEKNNIKFNISNVSTINSYLDGKIKNVTTETRKLIIEKVLCADNNEPSNLEFELLEVPKVKKGEIDIPIAIQIFDDFIFVKQTDTNYRSELIDLRQYINQEKFKEINKLNGNTNYKNFLNIDELLIKINIEISYLCIRSIYEEYFRLNNLLFLPSERNLYIQNALDKTIDYENVKMRYSEKLFIKAYLDFTRFIKTRKLDEIESHPFYEVANSYNKLFGGKIKFNTEGEVESLQMNGVEINRILFSTKINRLIPYLVISQPFKHYNKIIIEEPEAHLSLKSMSGLLNFFNGLLIEDKELIITTHSDVFFARLNNLILKTPKIKVKVYELEQIEEKSVLKEVEKTDNGFEIKLFTEELNELFEETINIQNGD